MRFWHTPPCLSQIFSQLFKSTSTKCSLYMCGCSHTAQDSHYVLVLLYLLALNSNFNILFFVYCVFRGNLKAGHLTMHVLQTVKAVVMYCFAKNSKNMKYFRYTKLIHIRLSRDKMFHIQSPNIFLSKKWNRKITCLGTSLCLLSPRSARYFYYNIIIYFSRASFYCWCSKTQEPYTEREGGKDFPFLWQYFFPFMKWPVDI